MHNTSIISLDTDPAYIIIFDKSKFPLVNLLTGEGRFDYHVHDGCWKGHEKPAQDDFFEDIILEQADGLEGDSRPSYALDDPACVGCCG